MCYFERTLNIHPPFVVSVAGLIINIHKYKSRAVTLYLIKNRILIRGDLIDKLCMIDYLINQWPYELLISF